MSIFSPTRFATVLGMALAFPVPVFPQYPKKLNDPGLERAPKGNRKWGLKVICRTMRGWLFPYVRSRVLPQTSTPSRRASLSSTSADSQEV